MRLFLLIVLAFASVWDAFTTTYGTIQVLGNGPTQLAAALLFSALVFSFVLNTRRIVKWQTGFVNFLAKFLWFIAFGYDLFTSWVANTNLLVGGSGSAREIIILVGLTVLVSASPILLSGMWPKNDPEAPTSREVRVSSR